MTIRMVSLIAWTGAGLALTGCSTAPRWKDRPKFIADATTAKEWFEQNVTGLRSQIEESAGYVIFPSMAQWGTGLGGGKYGRGMVNDPLGSQIGWAAISTGAIGLQVGLQGFKMLIVFKDQATLERFMNNRLSGSVSGVAVAANVGTSAAAQFERGVAIYQGASVGLMAGVNVGLDYLHFEPLRPLSRLR